MKTIKKAWSWDAKNIQVDENSKVGDIVNVGYISDYNKHNYEDASIHAIRKVKYYPDGTFNSETIRYQVWVKFANGDIIQW